MPRTRKIATTSVKKSDTAASASTENNAPPPPPATRKRGRPPTKKTAETDGAEKTAIEKSNEKEEGNVKELDVSKQTQEDEEPVVKRKRGRPAKLNSDGTKKTTVKKVDPEAPKRGRGRPRKVAAE